jgi:hypothetical protein
VVHTGPPAPKVPARGEDAMGDPHLTYPRPSWSGCCKASPNCSPSPASATASSSPP